MDDINFDELDKAVNSAMQPAPASSNMPAEPAPLPAAAAQASTDSTPTTVVPPKRRGQFMDMVHPSSDMSKPSTSPSPARRPSPVVTPLNPSIVETSGAEAQAPSTVVQPVAPETTEPSTPEQPPVAASDTHTWPDPIDMAEQTAQQPGAEEPVADDAAMAAVENSFVDTGAQGVSNEPAETTESDTTVTTVTPEGVTTAPETVAEIDANQNQSPFVEGATVEKRPLGAFATGEAVEQSSVSSGDSDIAAETPVQESSEQSTTVDVSSSPETPPSEQGTGSVSSSEEVVQDTSVSEVSEQSVAAPETGIAQSIPQQYHPEETKQDSDEEHAVFDTAEYHQPLPVPEKPKATHKAVFYVFLAVLMLAIGAAAGYAIFVLKLF